MIRLEILHTFTLVTPCGVVDKIKSRMRKARRSNPAYDFLFIVQLENILRSNLKFSTSYGY